jgi:hypothetical protein
LQMTGFSKYLQTKILGITVKAFIMLKHLQRTI